MENRGLLFIPDISGYTRFVNKTDIEHSRLIMEELLEILINANEIGLEVSEIEGDAILFYKFGQLPDMKTLYRQVEKMFCEFHRHLVAYDLNKYCQCQACMSAIDLTLKVITHYGEFTGFTVRNFNKLIGKDVIVAHQLLKNDIEQHEYWLVTPPITDQQQVLPDFAPWMQWEESTKQTEHGAIPFHYTQLGRLKNEIPPFEPLQLGLSEKIKLMSVSREYETDIIRLFHASGDFRYRNLWQEGVKSVEELSHFLPRVGMRRRTIMENGEKIYYASSYSFHPDRIEFSETDENKRYSTTFTLERINDTKVRLAIDHYGRKDFFSMTLFNLFRKKKMEKSFQRSLEKLDTVVKQIKLPGDER